MGTQINRAKDRAKEIQRLLDNGGSDEDIHYELNRMEKVYKSASETKKGRAEAGVIKILIEDARKLISNNRNNGNI